MILTALKSMGVFLFQELPLEIASIIVVPIALLFCSESDDHLPKWASWFDEYDYGINGDPDWQGPAHANGQQREYVWRWRWLMRNRINTFSKTVTGFPRESIIWVRSNGKFCVSDQGGCNGLFHAWARTQDGKTYHEYYFIYRYSKEHCVRIRFGWKLKAVAEEYAEDGVLHNREGMQKAIQHGLVINPFIRYLER